MNYDTKHTCQYELHKDCAYLETFTNYSFFFKFLQTTLLQRLIFVFKSHIYPSSKTKLSIPRLLSRLSMSNEAT